MMKILFASFLFICASYFAQAQTYTRTIIIDFKEIPNTTDVEIAKLMYNKQFAYSLTVDDGNADIWNVGFLLLEGLPVVKDHFYNGSNFGSGVDMTVPGGFNTSDGCGNLVNYKLGLALNSRYIGLTPSYINWAQVQEVYDAGWDIFNHSYNHEVDPTNPQNTFLNEPISMMQAIEGNSDSIQAKIGFYPRHFVIPSNSEIVLCEFGLTEDCPTENPHGMYAIYNQNYDWLGHTIEVGDSLAPGLLKVHRHSTPSEDNPSWENVIKKIDQAVAESNATNPIWFNEFTHSLKENDGENVPGATNLGFTYFLNLMNHLDKQYGLKGDDKMWVAGLQKVYEYIYLRDNTSFTTSLEGKELTVTMTFDKHLEDQENYNLSLNVSANVEIENISIAGEEYATYNPSTGLVNFELIELDTTVSANAPLNQFEILMSLSPNPANDFLKVNIYSPQSVNIQFDIINELGQVVQTNKNYMPQGESQVDFNIADLKMGKYILRASNSYFSHTVHFVKMQ